LFEEKELVDGLVFEDKELGDGLEPLPMDARSGLDLVGVLKCNMLLSGLVTEDGRGLNSDRMVVSDKGGLCLLVAAGSKELCEVICERCEKWERKREDGMASQLLLF
jgi:hypothetical protein